MSSLRPLFAVAAGMIAASMTLAAPAGATPNFPGALASKLGASQPPDCSICHVCGVTGRGTVNTPWGAAMRSRGLQAYDEGSLRAAATKMEEERVDSDGDGTIDVDALREGKDPNPPTCDAEADPTIPEYGCISRVATGGPVPGDLLIVAVAAAVATIVLRRRRSATGPGAVGLLLVVAASAGLSACRSSGAHLATRSDVTVRSATIPRMAAVRPSAFAAELRSAGLDPANLPPFERLTPRQVRRVMSTFTRSLGFACTDCHDRDDYRTTTRTKWITVTMRNELTRPYALEGGVLYCDSCHNGEGRFLDRRDKKLVAAYMGDEFLGKLARHDRKDTECETCHGDPFRPLFLPR